MEFAEPETAEEVAAILAADPEARCLAGGATLIAMMNAELVAPTRLVSLRRVRELAEVTVLEDGAVRIGAMARHAAVAASSLFSGGQRIVARAAARIGHAGIRNMGTIGGSICHADPSADHPVAITAADASVEVLGPDGRRSIQAGAFFSDWFETALQPGELVISVIVPPLLPGAGVHYEKLVRADGDFATVSVAAVVDVRDEICRGLSVAVGGVAGTPVRDRAAEQAAIGGRLDEASLAALGAALAARCNPIDDMRGSAAYRLKLVPRLVARAIRKAAADRDESTRGEHIR